MTQGEWIGAMAAKDAPEPVLLECETAAILCLSADQVAGYARDGELRYINVGRGKTGQEA